MKGQTRVGFGINMHTSGSQSESTRRPQPLTRSIVRGLALLEAIAQQPHELTSTRLAPLTDIDTATTIRLLRTLKACGYVHQDSSRRYFLTAKLLRLAHSSLDAIPIAAIARPYLMTLRDQTAETVHLAFLENDRVVYVDKLASPQPIQLVSSLGLNMPLNTTGLGKAICASLGPEELDELLDRLPFEARTSRSILTAEGLREDIAAAADRGYSVDLGENEDGVVCVSLAIPDPERVMPTRAAISISGPDFRMSSRLPELGRMCRYTAIEISYALGLTLNGRNGRSNNINGAEGDKHDPR